MDRSQSVRSDSGRGFCSPGGIKCPKKKNGRKSGQDEVFHKGDFTGFRVRRVRFESGVLSPEVVGDRVVPSKCFPSETNRLVGQGLPLFAL